MLNSKTLKCIGYFTLGISATLLVLIFLIPYLILKDIMTNLKIDFQLSDSNKKIWSNITNGKEIYYNKSLKFYNLDSPPYYQIGQANLVSSLDIVFNKSTILADIQFLGDKIVANLEEEYSVLPDYSDDYSKKMVNQYRPGVLRAVSELERRPPR